MEKTEQPGEDETRPVLGYERAPEPMPNRAAAWSFGAGVSLFVIILLPMGARWLGLGWKWADGILFLTQCLWMAASYVAARCGLRGIAAARQQGAGGMVPAFIGLVLGSVGLVLAVAFCVWVR